MQVLSKPQEVRHDVTLQVTGSVQFFMQGIFCSFLNFKDIQYGIEFDLLTVQKYSSLETTDPIQASSDVTVQISL